MVVAPSFEILPPPMTMALSFHANARFTETGRARGRKDRKFEDHAWAYEQTREMTEEADLLADGGPEEILLPLTSRMLALYEISWRSVEDAAPAPTGKKLTEVFRAEAVGYIAAHAMHPPMGDLFGLPTLCAAIVQIMVETGHRNASRQRLTREAVAHVLAVLSLDELVEVVTWQSDFANFPEYGPHCARLRELTIFELTTRGSRSAIDDVVAQLTLPWS